MSLLRTFTRRSLARNVTKIRPIFSPILGLNRSYSTTPPPPTPGGTSKWSPFFTALLVGGIGLTAYGVYDIYEKLTMWPLELRDDLRQAMKAKYKEDLPLSTQYLTRAWNTAKGISLDTLGQEPYLKLSGVAVALADVLEMQSLEDKAYEIYADAFAILQNATTDGKLTGPERLRAVSIAYKLGEMAENLHKPEEEEEKWLSYAATEVLKLVKEAQSDRTMLDQVPAEDTQITLAELQLPDWVTITDVGAPLEALGAFYSRRGKVDYAMPLYLQAINVLIPPAPTESLPEDRCRGAQMMGNLSDLILRSPGPPSAEKLHQAEAWAKKGLTVIHTTRQSVAPQQIPVCEMAYAVALFNAAMLREVSGDRQTAIRLFTRGRDHSRQIGLEEGVKEAEEALRRVGGGGEDLAAVADGGQ